MMPLDIRFLRRVSPGCLLLLLWVCGLSACAGQVVSEYTWPRAPGVVYLEVTSVTYNAQGFTLQTAFNNLGNDHLLVLASEVTCGRGQLQGQLHTPYGGRQQHLTAWPHTRNAHELGCVVPQGDGDIWLNVGRVWSNPSQDRRTPERLLAENLLWKPSLHR